MSDIEEKLLDNGLEGAAYFVNPDFQEAIIGYTDDGSVVYDYDLMVESLMKEDNISDLDAVEFIDYNTLRTIPYMDGNKPIIMYKFL